MDSKGDRSSSDIRRGWGPVLAAEKEVSHETLSGGGGRTHLRSALRKRNGRLVWTAPGCCDLLSPTARGGGRAGHQIWRMRRTKIRPKQLRPVNTSCVRQAKPTTKEG
ncbi:hypothetical protein THAOC_17660 [Thalassiosira oceanica]|uniref:Uncharacterized protein n=1 Tax=Thalassiosira oceanica TaxID=159749 RepID=K0S926_THAOC|nr:hypothetical protein THAOC_17660 [Thalassiosira oceanica]|eukprot:EJK61790.1 hypothetical protein THAOC_17660 [Thalassiosira oceanica]